ncbi:hypothetical protein C0J52_25333 [Blattella germanica]|nr:hypothetical protein C0J52_25333 [Blattella germanica]
MLFTAVKGLAERPSFVKSTLELIDDKHLEDTSQDEVLAFETIAVFLFVKIYCNIMPRKKTTSTVSVLDNNNEDKAPTPIDLHKFSVNVQDGYEDINQYSRGSNIEIHGLPESNSENIYEIVSTIVTYVIIWCIESNALRMCPSSTNGTPVPQFLASAKFTTDNADIRFHYDVILIIATTLFLNCRISGSLSDWITNQIYSANFMRPGINLQFRTQRQGHYVYLQIPNLVILTSHYDIPLYYFGIKTLFCMNLIV